MEKTKVKWNTGFDCHYNRMCACAPNYVSLMGSRLGLREVVYWLESIMWPKDYFRLNASWIISCITGTGIQSPPFVLTNGQVGQRFIALIVDSDPYFTLGASPRSVGKLYPDAMYWKFADEIPGAVNTIIVTTCEPQNVTLFFRVSPLMLQVILVWLPPTKVKLEKQYSLHRFRYKLNT